MANILACIDGSAFTESVCDHAAWLAGLTDSDVLILHSNRDAVPPGFASADALLDHSVRRLRNEGVADVVGQQTALELVEGAAALDAQVVVMGKRGIDAETNRRTLGSHVEAMLRRIAAPVCLTPKLFLPVHRALVLVDSDMSHRQAVDFVASHSNLADIECDLAVIAEPGRSADEKAAWARRRLGAHSVQVIPIEADDINQGVSRYMASRRSDLIVISRQVLLPSPQRHLDEVQRGGLWSWRTPVLVC